MEINPPRSKDPGQPRDTIPSHLIAALTEEAESLIQPEQATYQHPIELSALHDYTKEAYGEELTAESAYLDVAPFVSSLFITLDDNSYLEYTLNDVIAEAPCIATVSHFMEYNNGTSARLISERDMNTSDLIVFVRALDSVKPVDESYSI